MHNNYYVANSKFQICCGNRKAELPKLKEPPPIRHLLFHNGDTRSKNYKQHIRFYNMMIAFTSLGVKCDNRFNNGRCPPTLQIQGQTCQRICSLLPTYGQIPNFPKLYIYVTQNEVQNQLQSFQ